MDKVRDILALVVILGILGASLAGIYFLQKGIEVQIYNPERRSVVRTIAAAGEVKFIENNEIISPFSGRVSEIFVEKGDRVDEGEPLFSYSEKEWKEQVGQKEMQIRRYEDQLSSKIKQLERELADLEESKLDWVIRGEELDNTIEKQKIEMDRRILESEEALEREKEELKNLEELLAGQHVSRREVDQARERVEALERDLINVQNDRDRFFEVELPLKKRNIEREGIRIENNIERVREEIAELDNPDFLTLLEEEIIMLQEEINRLEEKISQRVVHAPSSGYLTNLNIEKGQQIVPDRKVMTINDPEFVEIVLKVDGKDFHRLEKGLEVEVMLEDIHPPLSGEISWIATWAEGNMVKAGVKITDRRDIIKPGMQVEATINLPGRRLLVVPPYAVFERKLPDTRMVIREGEDVGHYVFLVDKDTREVYPHRVRIGQETADFVEIVSGLSTSSNVVIGNTDALNQLGSKFSEWEQRMIEEIKVNFTGEK